MSKFVVNESGMKELMKEIKSCLKLKEGDTIVLESNTKSLILSKDGDFCFICGSGDKLYMTGSKQYICGDCLKAMQKVTEMKKTD